MSWNALNLVSIYPIRLHWSTLSGKRTNFYTYLATAQKSKYAVVPIETEEKFQLFNSSVSLNGNGFHHMVPLILKEWQPGGQLQQMERKYITRCMSILKVTTRNGQIKSRKRRI